MPHTAPVHGRRLRLLPLLLVALLAAVQMPSAQASPGGDKLYTATAPSTAARGDVLQLSLTNCGPCEGAGSSRQAFASAEVQVPLGVLVPGAAVVDRAGWSAVASDESGRTVVRVRSSRSAAPVSPGSAVRISLPVAVRAPLGPVTLSTAVKQSNDFSGRGNDFTRVGADPTVTVVGGAAVAVELVVQPTTIQVTTTPAPTAAGVTPQLVMCPAPVARLVDAAGDTATSAPATTVTLSGVPGLALGGGPVQATTVAGVAVFGDCTSGITATTVGRGLQVVVSAGSLTPDTSDPFDVLPVYGACPGDCSVAPQTGTSTQTKATSAGLHAVAQTGAGPQDRLTFGVDVDPWTSADLAACDPDPGGPGTNPFRAVVTVDLANHDKTVQLRWSKDAVQWATNNGASQWQVCLAAEARFAAVGGDAVAIPGTSWWVGALLPCSSAPAGDPCVTGLRRDAGDQVATVRIPNRPGDPRMI